MKKFKYLTLIALTLALSNTTFVAVAIAEEFGGKEYRWIKDRKTQTEAQEYAVSLGGHLAVINSAAEDSFVYSMVRGNIDLSLGTASDGGGAIYVWLGGNDASQEGDWVWVNGDSFTYTNCRAEPDNFNSNQDGLALGLENWPFGSSSASAYGLAGQWNDINRGNRLTFIVELPLQSNEEDAADQDGDIGNDDSSSDSDDTGSEGVNLSEDFSVVYDLSFHNDGVCGIEIPAKLLERKLLGTRQHLI